MTLTFYKQIQEKLGKHNPEDVDKLILDDMFSKIRMFSEDHKKSLEKYADLKHLSLNNIGLACLKNFPLLPNVKILELRGNLLKGDDFDLILGAFPNIRKLKVGSNNIKDFSSFSCFKNSDLSILELYETPLSSEKQYKEKLFHMIKTLEIIDQTDRDGYTVETYLTDEEFEEEEEDGDYSGNEDCEDEFDDDFYEEEESLELSEYDSEGKKTSKKK